MGFLRKTETKAVGDARTTEQAARDARLIEAINRAFAVAVTDWRGTVGEPAVAVLVFADDHGTRFACGGGASRETAAACCEAVAKQIRVNAVSAPCGPLPAAAEPLASEGEGKEAG
uniref:Uncharacterized protein n=1 Tax=viral metagenome TaxID=1070528 RepID=A0A6M3LVP7_9ZZZZ